MSLQEKLQRVVDAALAGPGIEDISIKGHDFNVDRAKRTVEADRIIIDGKGENDNISHRLTLVNDDQIDYKFVIRVSEAGVFVEDIDVRIKEGGLLNTWGAPIAALVENWDSVQCLWNKAFGDDATVQPAPEESTQDFDDCDIVKLVKALYKSVKTNSSDFDIGDVSDVSIADLEADDMNWRQVARLMVLSILTAAMGFEIARVRPSWIEEDGPILNVAPEFVGGNQVVLGVSRLPKNVGLGAKILFRGGNGKFA